MHVEDTRFEEVFGRIARIHYSPLGLYQSRYVLLRSALISGFVPLF
jgi:hypothetical protein